MHAGADEVIDEGAEAGEVEILVGQHRRGDGRDDAADFHGGDPVWATEPDAQARRRSRSVRGVAGW